MYLFRNPSATYGLKDADGKFANKNAPAMMGAFRTHHRNIYVWV